MQRRTEASPHERVDSGLSRISQVGAERQSASTPVAAVLTQTLAQLSRPTLIHQSNVLESEAHVVPFRRRAVHGEVQDGTGNQDGRDDVISTSVRVKRDRSLLLGGVLIIPILVAILAALPSVAPAANAAQTCYNDYGNHGTYRIFYNNEDTSFSNCSYSGEYEWLSAFRDGTARGVTHQSHYDNFIATAEFLSVMVTFHPVGATGYVTTSGGGGEQDGWTSKIKVGCHDAFAPVKNNADEGTALRDFAYHVGEVAKTNNQYYEGQKVAAAELISKKGNKLYYAPQCTDLH